jgi:E3 ubiquitin-protein ligase HECTD1
MRTRYRLARYDDDDVESHPWDVFFVDERIGSAELSKAKVITYLQQHGRPAWLNTWKLRGNLKAIGKIRSSREVAAAYRDFVQCSPHTGGSSQARDVRGLPLVAEEDHSDEPTDEFDIPGFDEEPDAMEEDLSAGGVERYGIGAAAAGDTLLPPPSDLADDSTLEDGDQSDKTTQLVLRLIRVLHDLSADAPIARKNEDGSGTTTDQPRLHSDGFISQKLTTKLRKQMLDPLVLASNALPTWCEELTTT